MSRSDWCAHDRHDACTYARCGCECGHETRAAAGVFAAEMSAPHGTIGGEPDRSVSALQPGSDHLPELAERG